MLINITNEKVKVVYNGKSRELNPGEGIDIRDFDIENKHVSGAEKHIMSKSPGNFEQKPNIGKDPSSDKAYLERIKLLEDKNAALIGELAEVRASEKIARQKHAAAAGEVETAKQEVASMKKEVAKYKAENEHLEKEVEQLRLSSRKLK